MRLTVLGSGTSVPVPDRTASAVLVEADGARVLVDCGPGTLLRLCQAGCGPALLDAVVLTHLHPDHTADLAGLLFALRRPAFAGRPPLRVAGPEGTVALVASLRAAWPGWLEPRGVAVEVGEIVPGLFAAGRLRGEAHSVPHTAASFAYRLEDERGAALALSGDSPDCAGLREAARSADLFVCEASFPEGRVQGAHLSARGAGTVARDAGARRLVLTHLSPEWDGDDPEAEARAVFPGPVRAARDLDAFDL